MILPSPSPFLLFLFLLPSLVLLNSVLPISAPFFSMGFFVQDPSLIVTHILYKTAVVLAVLRWVLSWALSCRNITFFPPSDSEENSSGSCSSSSLPVSSQAIRDSLVLSTFDDVKERLPWVSDTCAVCLGQLGQRDEVRELRNCCHVFHRECIDRWVDHHEDNHKTCPLCRAPLLASSQALSWPSNEPSWAVERLLYLFGDDLDDCELGEWTHHSIL